MSFSAEVDRVEVEVDDHSQDRVVVEVVHLVLCQ